MLNFIALKQDLASVMEAIYKGTALQLSPWPQVAILTAEAAEDTAQWLPDKARCLT